MLDRFELGRKSVKEKGIATAVIASVIIVILVVAGASAYFLTKPGPEGEEGVSQAEAVTLNTPVSTTENSTVLSWSQSTAVGFVSYTIYQSTSSGVLGDQIAAITDATTTSLTITGLSPSKTYYFTVRVNHTGGIYNDSNQVSVKTLQEVAGAAYAKNIMLTGYWSPTGQMIAQFSQDPNLNPNGWKGENWEGRGYNIYSYFPTPTAYTGDFEVDYQDTWQDFWGYTSQIHPVATISFGAGGGPWEIEYNARNLDSWVNDSNPPYQPTPSPPDNSKPVNHVRHSTLPVQAIADAVNAQTSVSAWVDWNGNPGAYLCEYMAYLGMWYQDIHSDPSDNHRCFAAGFIHVGSDVLLPDAVEATNVTLRETINYLDSVIS